MVLEFNALGCDFEMESAVLEHRMLTAYMVEMGIRSRFTMGEVGVLSLQALNISATSSTASDSSVV